MTATRLTLVTLIAALTLTGCKHTPVTETRTIVDLTNAGTISGTVHFDGKPPAPVTIDMSMDPACAMSATPNSSEQLVVANHALANVYIYIKSGMPSTSAAANTAPVVLDQKGCRYLPHVIALQQGGAVEFHNSDPTMHNIHSTPADGTASVDISQPPLGQPQTQKFDKPETMLPVRCNNHPWMNAFINVAPNPYFAVTGADGSFTLKNLPPGTYILAAVHETLGEQDIQVTVQARSTAPAAFSFVAK